MDYKKEYEAMVQRARELHEGGNALTKLQMEIVCPELADSEDEKIRKEIRNFLIDMECKGDWIAYLEKQKEQNPAEWSEEDERMLTGIIERGSSQVPFGEPALREEQMEWLMNIPKFHRPQSKKEWSEEDKNKLYQVMETLIADKTIAMQKYPRCKALHRAYNELIDWLKSLPDGYSIKSKGHLNPNEEDTANITDNKKFFLWIYDRLLYVYKENADIDYMRSFRKRIDQLFSKPQWKPSEAQMGSLRLAIDSANKAQMNATADTLNEIYEQLKEL